MRHRALLASRLPLRLSRWRTVRPEDADAAGGEQRRVGRLAQREQVGVEPRDLGGERLVAARQAVQGGLGRGGGGVAVCVGPQPGAGLDCADCVQPVGAENSVVGTGSPTSHSRVAAEIGQRRPRRRSPPGPEPDAGPPRSQRRHFYRTRKLLIAAHETITDKGEAKLLGLFAAGDPHSEVRDSLAATSSRSQHRTTITMSQSNRGRDPFSSSRYESGVIQGATFLDGQRHRRSLWDDVWSVARRHRRFRLMNP